MKLPIVTDTARLTSAGYNYSPKIWTLHTYDHSEVMTIRGSTGLAHFFKCNETGTLRRWGFDVTFAGDKDEDDEDDKDGN